MNDTAKTFIRDLRINLNVGMFEAEFNRTQPVVVNVECETRLTRRYDDPGEKDLAHVVNYRPVYQFIRDELTRMGHIYLLESAAEKIADFCLRDARVEKVRVRVEKTAIFPDAAGAGVEITRVRP